MKKSELERCVDNGVSDVVDVKIGYDGIVIANAKRAPFITLNSRQIFLALAKTVHHNGSLMPNPYQRWIEISLTLPSYPIRVLRPPSTSGTRDAFIQMALRTVARAFRSSVL